MTFSTVFAETCFVDIVLKMTIDALLRRIEKSVGRMAVLTHQLAMRAEQRKLSQIVIESNIVGPVQLGMTLIAVFAELLCVRIVFLVTTNTRRCRKIDCDRIGMTIRTFEIRVCPVQGEIRVHRVIETDIEPVGFTMAIRAFRAVDPIMSIILEVTANALVRGRYREFIAFMTGFANEARMAIDQRKCGCREVIEGRLFPVERRMTVLTLRAIQSHMRIVLEMAADASRRCLDVALVHMTTDAGQRVMRTRQREAARKLVIVNRIRPFGFSMTVGTNFAEISEVLVVFQMTGDALGLGRVKGRIFGMTIAAFRFDMTVSEREVCKVMIECRLDQAEHIGIAAFVIGMADHALPLTDIGRQAMETRARTDIDGNLGVAIKTQGPLRGSGKSRVAATALGLVFSVVGDQRSRRDESLEYSSLGISVHAD